MKPPTCIHWFSSSGNCHLYLSCNMLYKTIRSLNNTSNRFLKQQYIFMGIGFQGFCCFVLYSSYNHCKQKFVFSNSFALHFHTILLLKS